MESKQLVGVMLASLTVFALGCSDSKGSAIDGSDGKGANGTGGSLVLVPLAGSSSVGTGGAGNGAPPGTLPAGFTKADVGGYRLGAPITSDTGSGSAGSPASNGDGCGTVILGVIRDFKSDHPDFEKTIASEEGLVEATLGADRKPVFAHAGATETVSGPESFDQWYRNVTDVNLPFVLEVFFAPSMGTTSFQSRAFFPLDGEGFGNEDNNHNFHFTTEIHTQFRYNGGEVFNFTGDDDVWIFINNHLLVDLGGVHGAKSATVDMDMKATEVGIATGQVYPFDMFQAERHTSESNFRADTNLEFVDCGTIVPDVPK
jgi:fibro-slime domain-containing protein